MAFRFLFFTLFNIQGLILLQPSCKQGFLIQNQHFRVLNILKIRLTFAAN